MLRLWIVYIACAGSSWWAGRDLDYTKMSFYTSRQHHDPWFVIIVVMKESEQKMSFWFVLER